MMATLLIRLAAPLQSWGSDSQFDTRRTQSIPTKSGVVGLLAAALGRKRNESLHDLNALKMGVRVDQPGSMLVDFHTARRDKTSYISRRHYLSDAIFVVGLQSEDETLLNNLKYALQHPVYPLFLGRRSCPPTLPIVLETSAEELVQAIKVVPWQVPEWKRRKQKTCFKASIYCDDEQGILNMTKALSFNPEYRQYTYQGTKLCDWVELGKQADTEHDAMEEVR